MGITAGIGKQWIRYVFFHSSSIVLVSVDKKKPWDFNAKERQELYVQRYVARNSSAEIRECCSSSTVIMGYTERDFTNYTILRSHKRKTKQSCE